MMYVAVYLFVESNAQMKAPTHSYDTRKKGTTKTPLDMLCSTQKRPSRFNKGIFISQEFRKMGDYAGSTNNKTWPFYIFTCIDLFIIIMI
jgi:hypothetical protein